MLAPGSLAGALRSPVFLGHLLAIALCLAILRYAGRHRRDYVGGTCFALWVGATLAWLVAFTASLTVADVETRVVAESVSMVAVPFAAVTWLVFALTYSGRWRRVRRRRTALLVASAAVVAALVATNPVHGLAFSLGGTEGWGGVPVLAGVQFHGAFWLFSAFTCGTYLAGVGVLVDLVLSTNRLYRDQAAALVVAVCLPLAVATVDVVGWSPVPLNLTPLSFAASAAVVAYTLFRGELLSVVPASFRVGERKAIETLDQGVLVVDPDRRVVFANASVTGTLGTDEARIVGRPIAEVIEASPLAPAPDWAADGRANERADGGAPDSLAAGAVPRTLQHEETGRTFEVMESRIDEETGTELGRTLFLRDVTEERRRKQRLLVLNRVVRHNLRNDMNVLRGHVHLLEDRLEDEESLAVIDEIASDLIRLGEKAHQMDRIVRQASEEQTPVNVAGIVDRVADRVGEETGVSIDVDAPAQAWTNSHGTVVQAIVSNLVENAVEHGTEGTEGSVRVAVDVADGEITLTVADDGPGIPEQEVATLQSGEISALQHGSGIGLWVVKWCVDLTNADWTIETGDGTTVRVTFPQRTDAPQELRDQ